ncbi:MAG TPA: nuclear transport factor 2 family protein [Rhizomicrobium sp.]|nr:nuclear transport factor 2 family protein [Rhizomicrobium sp.]
MTDAKNAAARYIAAWNERDEAERRALIAATYTEDAHYVDPARSGKGHDGLSGMIAAVHTQFPPAYRFRLKGEVESHNALARFQWEAGGEAGAPLHFIGTDIIELASDGRIRSVAGFVDQAPPH